MSARLEDFAGHRLTVATTVNMNVTIFSSWEEAI